MNLNSRRFALLAAQTKKIPVWDGVTVTTPALVDGYYQIYDGATLMGFRRISSTTGKKARLTASFALNDWTDYNSWSSDVKPANRFLSATDNNFLSELDGCGYTIYGLYINSDSVNDALFYSTASAFPNIHDIRIHGAFCGRQTLFTAIPSTIYNFEYVGNHIYQVTYGNGLFVGGTNGGSNTNMHSCLFCGTTSGYYQHGAFVGTLDYANKTFKNLGVIGSVIDKFNSHYMGAIFGGNTSGTLQNCWQSATLTKGSNQRALGEPSSVFTTCYCDSDKVASAYQQGITKATSVIKSQVFVDLLNSNLPSGCTAWKLETKGLLTGWPVLDF